MDFCLYPVNQETKELIDQTDLHRFDSSIEIKIDPKIFLSEFKKFLRYKVNLTNLEIAEIPPLMHKSVSMEIIDKMEPNDRINVQWIYLNGYYSCAFSDGCVEFALSFSQYLVNLFGACILYPVGSHDQNPAFLVLPAFNDYKLQISFHSSMPFLRSSVSLDIFSREKDVKSE
jgi:hypothetical protein